MSTLDDLADEALALVKEYGIAPTAAAEKVVSLDRLDENDLLYCAQRYVGSLVHTRMTEERRAARSAEPRRSGVRRDRVRQLVSVMESTMSHAVSVLLAQYQGADGVERPLCDFTADDHRYRMEIEAMTENGARVRRGFHEAALGKLAEYAVASIAALPMAEQYQLGRMLNG